MDSAGEFGGANSRPVVRLKARVVYVKPAAMSRTVAGLAAVRPTAKAAEAMVVTTFMLQGKEGV